MHVLFVDDNLPLLEEYREILRSQGKGYKGVGIGKIGEFADISGEFDVAFVDWSLTDGKGSDIIDKLPDKTRVYIVTAAPDDFDCWMYADQRGIKIIEKPFRMDTIVKAIRGEL